MLINVLWGREFDPLILMEMNGVQSEDTGAGGLSSGELTDLQNLHKVHHPEDTRTVSDDAFTRHLSRKFAFSQWIASTVQSEQHRIQSSVTDEGDSKSALESIFDLLSTHRVEEACEVAMDEGYPRLALLLAQATNPQLCDDGSEASDLSVQLQQWAEWDSSINFNDTGRASSLSKSKGHSNSIMDQWAVRVYKLLSGE